MNRIILLLLVAVHCLHLGAQEMTTTVVRERELDLSNDWNPKMTYKLISDQQVVPFELEVKRERRHLYVLLKDSHPHNVLHLPKDRQMKAIAELLESAGKDYDFKQMSYMGIDLGPFVQLSLSLANQDNQQALIPLLATVNTVLSASSMQIDQYSLEEIIAYPVHIYMKTYAQGKPAKTDLNYVMIYRLHLRFDTAKGQQTSTE